MWLRFQSRSTWVQSSVLTPLWTCLPREGSVSKGETTPAFLLPQWLLLTYLASSSSSPQALKRAGPQGLVPRPLLCIDGRWPHLSHSYADKSPKCTGILACWLSPGNPRRACISDYLLDFSVGCLTEISGLTGKSNDPDIVGQMHAGFLSPERQREDRS